MVIFKYKLLKEIKIFIIYSYYIKILEFDLPKFKIILYFILTVYKYIIMLKSNKKGYCKLLNIHKCIP